MTPCVHMHCNLRWVLPQCRLVFTALRGSSRPAVEMSLKADSLPGPRPTELQPNLLSLHAEANFAQ